MKKREETEVLESQVRGLHEELCAKSTTIAELQRQNEYFKKLFESQQLLTHATSTPSTPAASISVRADGTHESDANSLLGGHAPTLAQLRAEPDFDPLEATRATFVKRQKRADSIDSDYYLKSARPQNLDDLDNNKFKPVFMEESNLSINNGNDLFVKSSASQLDSASVVATE